MRCPNCSTATTGTHCSQCGTEVVSVVSDTMDTLIEQASVPNLAALFRAGKEAGLIKPAMDYTNAT